MGKMEEIKEITIYTDGACDPNPGPGGYGDGRKCSTPVIKRIPRRKRKEKQLYYFENYLYCPNCYTMYMVEKAKRYL